MVQALPVGRCSRAIDRQLVSGSRSSPSPSSSSPYFSTAHGYTKIAKGRALVARRFPSCSATRFKKKRALCCKYKAIVNFVGSQWSWGNSDQLFLWQCAIYQDNHVNLTLTGGHRVPSKPLLSALYIGNPLFGTATADWCISCSQ